MLSLVVLLFLILKPVVSLLMVELTFFLTNNFLRALGWKYNFHIVLFESF